MPADVAVKPSRLRRLMDSDVGWSFRRTPAAWLSALVLTILIVTAFLAPLIAPQNPHDLAQVFIDKAEIPPIWQAGGEWPFLLGTDPQGRDVLSAILYGTRVSLIIGLAAVVVSMSLGITIGLIAGYYGGRIDNLLMRFGDTVLSIPTLLMAILVSAIFRELLPPALREPFAAVVLVASISLTNRAGLDHGRAPQGICPGGAHHQGVRGADHAPAHPAQHADAGPGRCHAQSGAGDPVGGDPVLPGRRHADHAAFAGYADPHRQPVSLLRLLVADRLPFAPARADRTHGQSARRLVARCAEPEAAVRG
jgi:hypothetical protein